MIQPKILDQANTSQTVGQEDIKVTDNGKRHIAVGIAFHNVLLPQMKKYVDFKLENHHTELVKTFHIDDKNKFILPPNEQFSRHNKDLEDPNYSVKSHHQLAKLYLEPHMTKFDKITEESFDS